LLTEKVVCFIEAIDMPEGKLDTNFLEQELRDAAPEVEVAADTALLHSKEAKDQYIYGNWCVQVGMYERAISVYKQVIEIEPNFACAHHNLGFAYYKLGDFDEARHELQTSINLNPQNAYFHYTLGLLLHDYPEFEAAIDSFSQAISLNPEYIEALYERGILYDKLKRFEEAKKDFETILQLRPACAAVAAGRPTFQDARHNIGIIYIKLKQWDKAEETFLQCLEFDPNDADVFYHLGGIYLAASGDIQKAIDSFENAVYLSSAHLDAHYGLAQLYTKLRRAQPDYRRKAIDRFLELIRINENLQTFERLDEVFFILGSLYDDEPDDADLAIQAYRTGLEYVQSPEAHNNLGVLYSLKDMLENATEEFRQAIKLNPDYEHPYHNLAKIYFYERDEEILKDFHSWIENEPDNAAKILLNLSLALVDVARAEAYQSLYSKLHKIKNLIGVSGSKLRRAARTCQDNSELSKPLTEILTEQENYYNEMVSLLRILKQEDFVFDVVDINKTLSSVIDHICPKLSSCGIECQRVFSEDLPQVKGDYSQLKEVFNNIILNAAEAMENGGLLQIKTEYDDMGSAVKLTFTDTGHGIPKEELYNVLKPGYSLKEKGSGFGLSIVQRIVREHQGKIDLTSVEDVGTTVTIYLPVDLEAVPIQTNLQMRPIFYEAPDDLIIDELA
jgi:tetratricopeptide (TPR) repeat protein/two-component sensor histidine kinase